MLDSKIQKLWTHPGPGVWINEVPLYNIVPKPTLKKLKKQMKKLYSYMKQLKIEKCVGLHVLQLHISQMNSEI